MNEIEAKIEQWFAKHFHGLGTKLDTDLYNLIHAAKTDLKAVLGIAPAPASEPASAASGAPVPVESSAPGGAPAANDNPEIAAEA